MKNKYLLTALAVVGCSVAAQASTITWNFLEDGSNVALGNSATFTESGITLTAYGFTSANVATALYAKDAGAGEQGLGIASDIENEINSLSYAQVLLSTTPASSLTSLLLNSVQQGETAKIYYSTTLGSLGSLVGSVTSDTTFDLTPYLNTGYIGVTAVGDPNYVNPNVLISSVTGTISTVPDGGTTAVLLGGALMGIGLLRKKFLA